MPRRPFSRGPFAGPVVAAEEPMTRVLRGPDGLRKATEKLIRTAATLANDIEEVRVWRELPAEMKGLLVAAHKEAVRAYNSVRDFEEAVTGIPAWKVPEE